MGGPWTKDVPIYGGGETRAGLLSLVAQGPAILSRDTRHRWAFAYGDQIDADSTRGSLLDPSLAREVAPGVPLAELIHAVEVEDAMNAEDFLLRRTKLHLSLNNEGREAIQAWFESGG